MGISISQSFSWRVLNYVIYIEEVSICFFTGEMLHISDFHQKTLKGGLAGPLIQGVQVDKKELPQYQKCKSMKVFYWKHELEVTFLKLKSIIRISTATKMILVQTVEKDFKKIFFDKLLLPVSLFTMEKLRQSLIDKQ